MKIGPIIAAPILRKVDWIPRVEAFPFNWVSGKPVPEHHTS